MNHYEAEIAFATEKYCYHPKTGECEGADPDSYQDHGIILMLKAATLEELKTKIETKFFNLEKPIGADVQIFEGRLEITCESDTVKDQIDQFSIMIFKVEQTAIDLSNEPLFKGVNR